jgi:alpha-beta hydrolase superfamily lysophospholipase
VTASVVIVHGFGEHYELYAEARTFLEGGGLGVYGEDLKGHGRDPGRRGHIESWADYRSHVDRMVDSALQRAPGNPVFLLGNSMGGLIAAEYALHHGDRIAGLILLSPAVGKIGIHPILLRLSRLLSRIWPTFTLKSGIERSRLTRDPAAIARLDADPLVHSLGTARLGTEVQDAIVRVRHEAPDLTRPLLLLQGEADRVTSPESSHEFFTTTGSPDKTLKMYPGAYHNLVLDLVKEEVLRDIVTWIEQRTPA